MMNFLPWLCNFCSHIWSPIFPSTSFSRTLSRRTLLFRLRQLLRNKVDVLGQHRHDGRHLLLVAEEPVVGVCRADQRLEEIRHVVVDTCQNVYEVLSRVVLTQHRTQRSDEHRAVSSAEREITCRNNSSHVNAGSVVQCMGNFMRK